MAFSSVSEADKAAMRANMTFDGKVKDWKKFYLEKR
jgi:hypothetical protein